MYLSDLNVTMREKTRLCLNKKAAQKTNLGANHKAGRRKEVGGSVMGREDHKKYVRKRQVLQPCK